MTYLCHTNTQDASIYKRTFLGLFFMDFSKPAFTTSQHLRHLKKKGLTINDESVFSGELEKAGYFRMMGYMVPFRKGLGNHDFREGTTEKEILRHYHFDNELRSMVMVGLSEIEVAFRAKFGNLTALDLGPHWYLNPDHFDNKAEHSKFIEYVTSHCSETNELFIAKYRSKYSYPSLPPIWMVMELISFGQMVNLFQNLKDNDTKKAISAYWQQPEKILVSWLKSMNFVRNSCAHHSRLWNRRLPLKPMLPKREKYAILQFRTEGLDEQIFGLLTCMLFLLEKLGNHGRFRDGLCQLFERYSGVRLSQMGFPETWKLENLWRQP